MFGEFKKLNIATSSDTELIAWVRQAFPIILEIYRRFYTLKAMSCSSCLRKAECDKHNKNKEDVACLVLEPKIPKKYEGTGYREKNAGFLTEQINGIDSVPPEGVGSDDSNSHMKMGKSTLKAVRKGRSEEELMLYKNCPPHVFKPEQWEAVCLRFEYRLKQHQIAEKLDISRSAVSDRLRRAKKNMENDYMKINLKIAYVISRQVKSNPS